MKETRNRNDLIRSIAYNTGYSQKSIEEILEAESLIICEYIKQGLSFKNHKLYKLDIVTKEGYRAYNGLNKEYYEVADKKVVKFKPLSRLEKAQKEVNE